MTMERAIIISNGRCGSTLLSELITEEPETCSVQEFFMAVTPWSRSAEVLSAADYWKFLSAPKAELSVLFRIGVPPKEFRYPADGRYAQDLQNLPHILAIMLPKLTDDPDALFDTLAERIKDFPTQSIGAHHQQFLDLLTMLTGKKRWVERSGGSSQIAPALLSNFPTAKIVNLTRDWTASAKSMSKHPSFQLVQLRVEAIGRFGVDPLLETDGLPEEYQRSNITAEFLHERGQDFKRFLGLCAFMSSQAEQALIDHPPAALHTMAYEDLIADPVSALTGLGEFLGFADAAGWAGSVADRVRKPVAALA
jgi:putative sulfotransferase